MEKRHQTTLARTLTLTIVCTKLVLVGALFIPFLLTMEYRPQRETVAGSPILLPVPVAQKPPPSELMRIYSIVRSHRPDITETEAWELSEVILEESSGYGLDPMLVLAVIDVESKFQYGAVSPAGARGIMQILPYVGKSLVQKIGLHQQSHAKSFRPEFLDDPVLNIKLGVYYLHDLKKSFRNLTHTLIAYNMGPTETKNRLENDIELSEEYATTVLAAYQQYKHEKTKQPTF
ncbi:MAG TPA: lytic transglycosylase domain-containing protein [Candidatus Binatia bacterium]|nr:lytic transglycosylase domain-containing protein [Candidatus Binatia bacterium]